jgi:DNA mismatch repair protein MutL
MPRIKVLDSEVADQIAAGEVVERPASVVKELVENSLDAGAKRVSVEVVEAGRKLILAADDGEGMEAADLGLAVLRHATSKISASADLWDLHSFGFRGEALPSIASVSRLAITSRRREAAEAWSLKVEGGRAGSLEPASLALGTRVEVRDLFFNTPARLKFLKAPATESGRIQQAITSLALSAPQAAFSLRQDGRLALDWPASDLEGRARQALGAEFVDASLPLSLDSPAARVRGWVGRPHLHRGNRSGQWLFVAGRAVEHRLFNFTLAQAFGSLIPAGRFAQALVFLELPAGQVDVNVHPSKREVRFVRESDVLAALRHAVQAALGKAQLSVPLALDASRPAPEAGAGLAGQPGQGSSRLFEPSVEYGTQPASHQAESGWMPAPAPVAGAAPAPEEGAGLPLALAQLHRCYILCQSPEGLVLVDQHAGHERVLYERFLRSLERGDAGRQALLLPLKLELGPADAERLRGWMPALASLGLELSDLGGGAFYLMSLPAAFKQVEALPMLLDLLEDDAGGQQEDPSAWVRQEAAARLACRAAVKSGDPLTLEEMRHLVAELFRCQLPWACPHGRPPFVSVSLVELEKHFKRR